MNSKKLIFLLFILIASSVYVFPRDNDFGIWSYIEAEKKINKKWSVTGEIEMRTRENSEEISRWGLKVGGEYNIIKQLRMGAAYQFIYHHDLKYWDFQPRHRFIAYLQGKQKWNGFTFSLRERIQVTTKDESDRINKKGNIDRYRINPDWTWRNRIKIAYDISNVKITPAFSFESFYQLHDPDGNQFEGLRYTLSFTYKLNKQNSFEVFGVHDRDINVNNPVYRNILGIGYSYSL